MKKTLFAIVSAAVLMFLNTACSRHEDFKVWAWMSGTDDDELLERRFRNAAEAGVDAIFLECHGGYPVILDSTSFRDSSALVLLRRASVFAEKYGVSLHAWMWTTNRCEKTLREAHPDWYQVNGLGQSCNDIKLYDREHYRFVCPNHDGVTEYIKDRVRELAEIPGLDGIHMDFIRYPDAILPYGLHESRGVVQDKVYPLWDHCYCDECRAKFKALTGIDPIDLEDPTSNEDWMQFRWDTMTKYASEIAAEIKACGKISSAAVFATPEESRKLVRQNWTSFSNVDFFMPMIYNDSYAQPDSWVETATREGIEELNALGNPGELISGVIIGKPTEERLNAYFDYAIAGGSKGICLFSLESFDRNDSWEVLKKVITEHRETYGR